MEIRELRADIIISSRREVSLNHPWRGSRRDGSPLPSFLCFPPHATFSTLTVFEAAAGREFAVLGAVPARRFTSDAEIIRMRQTGSEKDVADACREMRENIRTVFSRPFVSVSVSSSSRSTPERARARTSHA
jgi:hypothetical protein